MEIQKLNIIDLIENNPLIKLCNNYHSKFIKKVQEHFTETEQKLFVSSFYCYLNYNSKTDFVIDIQSIWKWLGFSRKDHIKVVLLKHFKQDVDYICVINDLLEKKAYPGVAGENKTSSNLLEINFAPEVAGAKENTKERRGGLNKEKIMMTVNTFKKLCLKSDTKKADEIHDYFIKLEELTHETTKEESLELILQLQQKEELLIEYKVQTELEKEILLETTLLQQFPVNTQCIYIGKIDNKDLKNGNLVSFGMSNDLNTRIKAHKKTYTNFRLIKVYKVKNHIEIENCIKHHTILKLKIRYLMINSINHREHLCIDSDKKDPNFTLDKLDGYIKEIIEDNEYNIENYTKLSLRCKTLEIELKNYEVKCDKLNKEIEELDKFKPTTSIEEKLLKKNNKSETGEGYSLYVFHTDIKDRYKIGLCKTANMKTRENILKLSDKSGKMELQVKIKHPFLEKTLLFLIKKYLVMLNNDTFDGSINEINLILHIIQNLENLLIDNDLENIKKILDGEIVEIQYNDPEVPFVKKSKRSVDQVNKDTGEIISTYASIEEAGRKMNLTTGTAVGIALRNKTLCQGFLWRYSGFSKDEQFLDQKVIKINCKTGEKMNFANIADAARNAKLSAPGLRNRVLTDVHINGYHWVFDKQTLE